MTNNRKVQKPAKQGSVTPAVAKKAVQGVVKTKKPTIAELQEKLSAANAYIDEQVKLIDKLYERIIEAELQVDAAIKQRSGLFDELAAKDIVIDALTEQLNGTFVVKVTKAIKSLFSNDQKFSG